MKSVFKGFLPPILYFACQLLVTGAFMVARYMGILSGENAQYTQIMLLCSMLLFSVFLLLFWRRELSSFPCAFLRVKGSTTAMAFFLGAGMGISLNTVLALLNRALSGFFDSGYEDVASLYTGHWALQILVIGILGPVFEEVVFRGLTQKCFSNVLGDKWGIFLTAVLFGLIHGNLVQMIFGFIMGLYFGIIYYKTKNLWYAIAAHIGTNLSALALSFLGEVFSGAVPVVLVLSFILAGLLSIWLFKGPFYKGELK